MPIETTCTGCGRKLRVADEHLGKQARCPMCNTIYTVSAVVATGARAGALWLMKTPEGETYGPVNKTELDGWVQEGRVTDDCQLRTDDTTLWQTAANVYPQLRPHGAARPSSVPNANRPQSHWGQSASNAYQAPSTSPYAAQRSTGYVTPHRGALILVLGIIGLVTSCPILSIMAWVMGTSDLNEMRAGRMDASGMGMTQAGQILGMIYSILAILFAVMIFFVILLSAH